MYTKWALKWPHYLDIMTVMMIVENGDGNGDENECKHFVRGRTSHVYVRWRMVRAHACAPTSYIVYLISSCIRVHTHELCTKCDWHSAIQTKQKSSVNVYKWICQNWSISIEQRINHQTDWIPIHLTIEPNRIGDANIMRSHYIHAYMNSDYYAIIQLYLSIYLNTCICVQIYIYIYRVYLVLIYLYVSSFRIH